MLLARFTFSSFAFTSGIVYSGAEVRSNTISDNMRY